MINISAWKEFCVGDLFDIRPTRAYKLNKAQLLDGGKNPVIANSAYNNGVIGYSTQKPTEKGNIVTFSDTVDANTIFYQPDDFIGYSHVQGLYPVRYKEKWNKYTYLFFVSVFRNSAIAKGFHYGNKFRRDIAAKLMIKLPVTSDNQPDWNYMENYIKVVVEKAKKNLEELKRTNSAKNPVDVNEWKSFALSDLFELSLPKGDLQIKKVKDGNIPLITSSNINNGLIQRIAENSQSTLYKSGTITVDMFGQAYYQPENYFVTAHGHVNVLLPLGFSLNKYTGTFVASIIQKKLTGKYGFSEMCTKKALKAEFINLPANHSGNPNWELMEEYMKYKMRIAERKIRTFSPLIFTGN